ncbi:transposase [Fusarium oxysporum f. sp. phaseoli]
MEGQGINGLVIGSSQENPNTVPVKTINARTWTSIVECISALGVALNPLVIFKAKSIQEQWFKKDFLAKHPGWHVTFSENGWTSNDIAVEWLGKVVAKPLNSRWVVVAKRPAIPLPVTSDISTPKRGGDVVKLFAEKSGSPTSRLSIRKAAAALDKVAIEVILRDREIERLQVQLAQAKPAKRRKIVQDPNERFASLTQILAQANREPQQRVRKARNAVQEVIIVEGESSSESEEEPALARRSARNRRPTKCYMERDSGADEESE